MIGCKMPLMRSSILVAFLVVGSLVLAELLLQAASLFVDTDVEGWSPDAEIRVLAVGDSHTWGRSVPEGQNYPARLQRFLDGAAPGRYSVLNLGIPGTNTSQLLNLLGVSLAHWNPDIVVVWCGVNNTWNNAERQANSWRTWLDALALRLRLYRLARVWLHERALKQGTRKPIQIGHHGVETLPGRTGFRTSYFGDIVGQNTGTVRTDAKIQKWAESDYGAMVRAIRATGAEPIFVTYPLESNARFAVANQAMGEVTERHNVRLIRGSAGFLRVPEDQEHFSWALHPSAAVYREIARDVAESILEMDRG